MALINEIENYDDIKIALRGSISKPYSWKVRHELRDKLINAYNIQRMQMVNYSYAVDRSSNVFFRNFCGRVGLEEELHQAMLGTLFGSDISPWDLLARAEIGFIKYLAVNIQPEPDPSVKSMVNYILLDHLTHLKELSIQAGGMGMDIELVDEINSLPDGRKFGNQHVGFSGLIKSPYTSVADAFTKVSLRLVRAFEVSLREICQNLLLASPAEELKLFAREISVIDSCHLLMIDSMINPEENQAEQTFYDELAEVTLLNKLFLTEKEKSIKEIYDFMIAEDEMHLKVLGEMLYDFEGKDPSKLGTSKFFSALPRCTAERYLSKISSSEIDVDIAEIAKAA